MNSKRYRVLPYRQGSKSAKALATELGGKVLKLQGSVYTPKASDTVISWGNTFDNGEDTFLAAYVLNHPATIKNASNKLRFFQKMKDHNPDIIPAFWTKKEDIPDEAFPVVCRTILAGHSGAGIVIADCRDDLVDCPLFVKYIKKKDEYRIHVGKEGKIISVQRKARRHDAEHVNWKIRNLANGFVFVRDSVDPPASVLGAAADSLAGSGLDFGAVDVVWNDHEGKAYVLEINTAPGLEGQTIKDYADYFRTLSI